MDTQHSHTHIHIHTHSLNFSLSSLSSRICDVGVPAKAQIHASNFPTPNLPPFYAQAAGQDPGAAQQRT